MAQPATDTTDPLAIYQRMQEALLGAQATLLPESLLAEDLVVEMPFSQACFDGREAWLSFYRTYGAGVQVRFEPLRELATHRTDDPEVLVVEYELTGMPINSGVTATTTCIGVLRVRDGLITHWREYQDVRAISEALSL